MSVALDYRDCRNFVMVADLGSVTEAGERLGLTQSAVSQSIKRLETLVEMKLFMREGRRLRLTDQGEILRHEATRLIGSMQELQDVAQSLKKGEGRRLRLGVMPAYSHGTMLKVYADFAQSHSKTGLSVMNGTKAQLQIDLHKGALDMVVAIGGIQERNAVIMESFQSQIIAILPKSHPLAGHSVIKRDDLQEHRLISLTKGSPLRVIAEQLGWAIAPSNRIEVPTQQAVIGMVEQGTGIGLVDALSLMPNHNVMARPLEGAPELRVEIAAQRDSHMRALCSEMGKEIIKAFAFASKRVTLNFRK